MFASMRPTALTLVLFIACSGGENASTYPGDALAAIEAQCVYSQANKGCDRQCILDSLNVNEFMGAVCEGSKPLDDVDPATYDAYFACRRACPSTKCASNASLTQFDCACDRRCHELHLSKRVVGLKAFHADCLRALPSCR
jgi:hypothetical protein